MASSENLADLFSELWGRLSAEGVGLIPVADEVEGMAARLRQHRKTLLRALKIADPVPGLRLWLTSPPAGLSARHAELMLAQAIDEFHAPLWSAVGDPLRLSAALRATRQHLIRKGRLNLRSDRGRVIPRRPLWGRWSDHDLELPQAALPGSLFQSLLVLPEGVDATHPDDPAGRRPLRLDYRVGQASDGRARAPARWRIGFAPVARAQGDIGFTTRSAEGWDWYDAQPASAAGRVRAAIHSLCRDGAHIIIFPEMTLQAEDLDTVRAAIREAAPDSALHLVVAGTTRWDEADGRKPFNRCHVFDHAGEEIFRQDKISRWDMDRGACARFGLLGVDGAAPDMLHEYIEPAEAVAIVERPHFGRIAVMICEDLHRSEPGGWIRDTMLIDWQFTPVLDASLTLDRWSALHGGRAALAGSCRVVVANSFPMTHRQNAVNVRSLSRYPVVSDCGVGLCLDRHDDAVRATVLRLSLDDEGADAHGVVDWQPDQWDMAPALDLVGAL